MLASDLIGRTAHDADGRVLGRIADLLTRTAPDGTQYVHAALVAPRHRGRLFGYERDGFQGPWLIERLTAVLHAGTREIPWPDIHLHDDD
ncbi:PRC-barrel domain-containing protein [Actinophytocola sp. KF-1]